MRTGQEDDSPEQTQLDLTRALGIYMKWERLMATMGIQINRLVILRTFLLLAMLITICLSAYLWWGREDRFASMLLLGSALAMLAAALYSGISINLLGNSITQIAKDFEEEATYNGDQAQD